MKSIYILIGGRVQGVGFRYFTQYKANEFQLFGWVRNAPDGKVEIEASGEPENLEVFTNWMKIGPARAVVKTFFASEITPTRTYTNFIIR